MSSGRAGSGGCRRISRCRRGVVGGPGWPAGAVARLRWWWGWPVVAVVLARVRCRGRSRWCSRFVLPDDVGALADGGDFHAVGDDLDGFAVVGVAVEVGGDVVVQGRGVGVVQCDVGEVAGCDVFGEGGGVAAADDALGG